MEVPVDSSWVLSKSTGFSLLGALAWYPRLEGLPGLPNLLVKLFILADVRKTRGLAYTTVITQLFTSFVFPLSQSGFIYRLFLASLQKISTKPGQPLGTLWRGDSRALPCRSPRRGEVQQPTSFRSRAREKWDAKPEQTGGAMSIAVERLITACATAMANSHELSCCSHGQGLG